jgi:hypothetical protein
MTIHGAFLTAAANPFTSVFTGDPPLETTGSGFGAEA